MAIFRPDLSIIMTDRLSPVLTESVRSVMTSLRKSGLNNYEFFLLGWAKESPRSLDDLESEFPELQVVLLRKKVSRIRLLNYGLERAKGILLCSLNSNIIVQEDFITRIMAYQDKVNLFGLSPSVVSHAEDPVPLLGKFSLTTGVETVYHDPDHSCVSPTLFCVSGMAVYNREHLLALDGWRREFRAGQYVFWADTDLCWRAWEQGFGSLYDPEIKVQYCAFEKNRPFYVPVPDVLDREYFLNKFVWNMNRSVFLLRNGIPLGVKNVLKHQLRSFDVLGLLASFAGFGKSVFPGRCDMSLPPVWDYQKILDIAGREIL